MKKQESKIKKMKYKVKYSNFKTQNKHKTNTNN